MSKVVGEKVRIWARSMRFPAAIFLVLLGGVGLTVWIVKFGHEGPAASAATTQSIRADFYRPTAAQWATMTVETVKQHDFRAEVKTEGKIAIDEDRVTPVFSPYAGRLTRLLVKQGDVVTRGQPLFTVEATDMVQAQNEFIAALTALNKTRSTLNLAQIVDKRQRTLYDGKAVPLKEVQNARAALETAENDLRSCEVALEAARNRLRMLGKTDQEIAEFEEKGEIDPATPIFAPISGTIVQRRAGPGQYIGTGAGEPVFVIGDLSNVWLVAYVREGRAPGIRKGQPISFGVLAFPGRSFSAEIAFVATSLDPATRRMMVRATIDNESRLLKPEMFANVTIYTGPDDMAVSVPRSAVIHEGDVTRVWVVRDDNGIELRRIACGLVDGRMIQVVDGLRPGERIITKGSMFINRPAAGA